MEVIISRLAAALLLAGLSLPSQADQVDAQTARGQAIASSMCAQCHATGRTGESPHVGAPSFRNLDRRVDLDSFIDRLQQGLMSGHPDMPTFRFSRDDAHALVAYLRSIEP